MISRRVIEELRSLNETHAFLKGLSPSSASHKQKFSTTATPGPAEEANTTATSVPSRSRPMASSASPRFRCG